MTMWRGSCLARRVMRRCRLLAGPGRWAWLYTGLGGVGGSARFRPLAVFCLFLRMYKNYTEGFLFLFFFYSFL